MGGTKIRLIWFGVGVEFKGIGGEVWRIDSILTKRDAIANEELTIKTLLFSLSLSTLFVFYLLYLYKLLPFPLLTCNSGSDLTSRTTESTFRIFCLIGNVVLFV